MTEHEQEQEQPKTTDADEEEAAAEESEGEQPEAPPEGTPEDSASGEFVAPPMSEADIRKLRDRLDAEATRHSNRVSDILGEDAQHLVVCELCEPGIPGFHWPANVQQPYSPLHEQLLAVLRNPATSELELDPNKPACETCKGMGQIRTGSQVPTYRTLQCAACNGRGFVMTGAGAMNGPTSEVPVPVAVGAADEAAAPKDADEWGHPRLLDDGMENPNFGRMPQYTDPRYP